MAQSILAKLAGLVLALAVAPDHVAPTVDGDPHPLVHDRPTAISFWHTFRRHHLNVSGRLAFVVDPETAAPGSPWIWRATFWGFSPEIDVALLSAGFHVVYIDTEDMYGSPRALAAWDEMYTLATRDFALSKKPVLEGISRGGLYAYRWAEAHPDQVTAILGDAPVCDFRSWPMRTGSLDEWRALEKEYGFARDEDATAFLDNPVDRLAPLARADVLLVTIYGDADTVVPPAQNALLIAARYRALGGRVVLFPKPGVGHAHGLADPSPVLALLCDAVR